VAVDLIAATHRGTSTQVRLCVTAPDLSVELRQGPFEAILV
jgi:hypothetical protein